MIRGLPLTEENYDVAVALLTSRYADKRRTLQAHYAALRNLQKSPLDYRQMQRLADEIEMRIRSLEALGEKLQEGFILDLYRCNLPQEAISILEMHRGEEEWTLGLFHKKLTL